MNLPILDLGLFCSFEGLHDKHKQCVYIMNAAGNSNQIIAAVKATRSSNTRGSRAKNFAAMSCHHCLVL